MNENKPRENEIKAYGFGISEVDFKKFKDIIIAEKGFIGVHFLEKPPLAVIVIFVTENDAKVCRNIMEFDGCRVSRVVFEMFVPKDEVRNAD